MAGIASYGCSSACGRGVESFWKSLIQGERHAHVLPFSSPDPALRAGLWPTRVAGASALEELTSELLFALRETLESISSALLAEIRDGRRLGVILASTKGSIDDWVWKTTETNEAESDSLAPVLDNFLARAELTPSRRVCVSNACASSLSALFLADHWIQSGSVEHVLVLAADRVGPFVVNGFHCLRALSPGGSRPFSKSRDGLMLGDGASAILLSSRDSRFLLHGVGIDAEGYAVTRASESGESVVRACLQIPGLEQHSPELIIAHATGTVINDAAEDGAFQKLFGGRVPVTATKSTIGHTLGASGAMDVIAACESMRRSRAFRIAGDAEPDPALKGNYLRETDIEFTGSRVLVTSLGFGGIHAAALVANEFRKGVS
jgi:3-oxoacyl-(acyl-carrier-protein) synthase